jgi:hypothetical protein
MEHVRDRMLERVETGYMIETGWRKWSQDRYSTDGDRLETG